ncbi:hypothetical protein JZ751_024672, partial [Albula glossodonta]
MHQPEFLHTVRREACDRSTTDNSLDQLEGNTFCGLIASGNGTLLSYPAGWSPVETAEREASAVLAVAMVTISAYSHLWAPSSLLPAGEAAGCGLWAAPPFPAAALDETGATDAAGVDVGFNLIYQTAGANKPRWRGDTDTDCT